MENSVPKDNREHQPPIAGEGSLQPQRTRAIDLIKDLIPQFANIAKVVAWVVALIFVVTHWSYFGSWFGSATHVELPGVKIDRFVQASERVEAYAGTSNATATGFNLQYARAAIVRAERSSPAIKGAVVLWVDETPSNNQLEVDILSDLGIRFVHALSTKEAMERLERDKYDLVISNVGRNEPPTPLNTCQVHYFEWPDDAHRQSLNGNIDAFNTQINAAPYGGFSMMEQIKEKYGDDAPPFIFFTATSGGKVTTFVPKRLQTVSICSCKASSAPLKSSAGKNSKASRRASSRADSRYA